MPLIEVLPLMQELLAELVVVDASLELLAVLVVPLSLIVPLVPEPLVELVVAVVSGRPAAPRTRCGQSPAQAS